MSCWPKLLLRYSILVSTNTKNEYNKFFSQQEDSIVLIVASTSTDDDDNNNDNYQ